MDCAFAMQGLGSGAIALLGSEALKLIMAREMLKV